MRTPTRPKLSLSVAGLGLVAMIAAGCGGTTPTAAHPASTATTPTSGMDMGGSMAGMDMADPIPGNGLLTAYAGFRLRPLTSTAPAGQDSTYRFQVVQADGNVLTAYQPEQTKLLHFYLLRSDLTGFEHLHPALGADATWSVTIHPATAGTYRVYTQFDADPAGTVTRLVLSQPLTVTGSSPTDQPLQAAGPTATVDGYTLTVTGTPKAGSASPLTLTVTRDGQPVTDLQPYLDTYAHLTAIHRGDLAFAHLHPSGTINGDHGGHGGPTLTFAADFAEAGAYRVFTQFRTGGVLHTAAITLVVEA